MVLKKNLIFLNGSVFFKKREREREYIERIKCDRMLLHPQVNFVVY